jgi:hypothetical protein
MMIAGIQLLETLLSLINQYPEAQLFCYKLFRSILKYCIPKTAIQNTANHFIITDFLSLVYSNPSTVHQVYVLQNSI